MSRTLALTWKAWRDVRWLGLMFMLLVIVPTAYDAWENSQRQYDPTITSSAPTAMVFAFGGVFAIFLAIALTCRDAAEPTHTFWRSRAIGTGRYVTTKYLTGVLVLLAATVGPLLIELVLRLTDEKIGWRTGHPVLNGLKIALGAHTFTLITIYSSTFVLGCLGRRAVPAAMLGLAAALLIYCGTLLIPGTWFLSIFQWNNHDIFALDWTGQYYPSGNQDEFTAHLTRRIGIMLRYDLLRFIAGHLVLSAGLLTLAIQAIRRGWVWELDLRAVCWGLATVALILWLGSSREMGSNLPKPTRVDYALHHPRSISPIGICGFTIHGEEGVIMIQQAEPNAEGNWHYHQSLTRVHLGAEPRMGATFLRHDTGVNTENLQMSHIDYASELLGWDGNASNPVYWVRPTLSYNHEASEVLFGHRDYHYNIEKLEFVGAVPAIKAEENPVQCVDLKPSLQPQPAPCRAGWVTNELQLKNGGEFLLAGNAGLNPYMLRLDTQATTGSLRTEDRAQQAYWWGYVGSQIHDAARGTGVLSLPLFLAGMEPQAALRMWLASDRQHASSLEGDLLAVSGTEEAVLLARVTALPAATDGLISFRVQQVGSVPRPIFNRVFGNESFSVALSENVLYVRSTMMESMVLTYDVSDPARPRETGQFTFTDGRAYWVAPLPGGRAAVLGNGLWVLERPAEAAVWGGKAVTGD